MFKSTKITEHTVVLVENMDALIQISQIVSTTDPEVFNNFVAWTLLREFLPYMSREFRVSLEEFNRVLYGISSKQPLWYYCTNIIKDWLAFGVEALRDNPYLIVHVPEKDKHQMDTYLSESLIGTPVNFGDELLKMIFHHIKNEYKHAVSNTLWFSERLSKYVFDKLSSLRLQIGIPEDVLKNETFLNENYNEFTMQTIQFIENIENYWVFQKSKMDRMLGPMNENERIVSALFPQCKNCRQSNNHMTYSPSLNMVIISKEALREPYYSPGYPM
jgi:predicted metalloendopeptidase